MDTVNEKKALEAAQKEFNDVKGELNKMLDDFSTKQNSLAGKLKGYYQKRSKYLNTPK